MNKPAPITEFVGTVKYGNIVGLVITNIDSVLRDKMRLDKSHRAIGIISNRTGAGSQIMAADEAVKATNAKVVSVELPRDTKNFLGINCL
nr:BMC domain-containing protein [Haloimpatiens massiliensis]